MNHYKNAWVALPLAAALLAGCASTGSGHAPDNTLVQARDAVAQAKSQGILWTSTVGLLKQANLAAQKGDQSKADALAERVLTEVTSAREQAQASANAAPVYPTQQ